MTLATVISLTDFGTLVEAAFEAETPVVSSSESDLGQPLERFANPAEILAKATQCAKAGIHNYSFGLWYPSMKGSMVERQVTLDPPRDGHTFRYSLTGWGLIHLNLYFTAESALQCRVMVNSRDRALAREARYPQLGPVADWDWRVVESYAFRLTRRLAAMGPVAPVGQQPASPGTQKPASTEQQKPASPWKRKPKG